MKKRSVNSPIQSSIKDPRVISAFIGVLSVFFRLASDTCGIPILKWAIVSLITLSCIFACYSVHSKFKRQSLWKTIGLYLTYILVHATLAIYVITKKCDFSVSSKTIKTSVSGNATNINGSGNSVTVDNSYHNNSYHDERKTTIRAGFDQRVLTNKDIRMLKTQLTDFKVNILVQYLQSNKEDKLFWEQTFKALVDMGYSHVQMSPADKLPDDLDPGRMSIKKEVVNTKTVYKIIINPIR